MALSATTSFINGANACNGVLRICLRHADGAPFYDQFDICGGPATGVSGSNTGPQSGSLSTCSLTNFATENGHQCFDLNNYSPASGSSTADTIIIQPTDDTNTPVGNAVEIGVTFDACDGGNTGNLICAQSSTTPLNVTAGQTFDGSSFATNGTGPYTVTAATPGVLTVTASGDLQIVAGTTPGDYTRNVTVEDSTGESITCTLIFRISAAVGAGCIDTAASYADLSEDSAGPGDVITITSLVVAQNGDDLPGYYLLVKDSAGNIQAQAPAFQETNPATEQVWTWQVPQGCTDGNYRVCIYPPQGSTCPIYDAAGLAVSGCGGVGGTCKTAQVSVVAGSSTVITPGQVVAGASAFGSTAPATSANSAVAVVGSQSAGAFTVSGSSVGVTTITVDMGGGVSCVCTVNVTGSTGCSSTVASLTASPANPAPGQQVTLTAGGCTCTGCVVRITQEIVAGLPTVALSNGGETTGGGSVTYTHPATMAPGQSLRFNTQCCCPE